MTGRRFNAAMLAEAIKQRGLTNVKCSPRQAEHILSGPDGFLERGLVERDGTGYRATEKGLELPLLFTGVTDLGVRQRKAA